MSLSGGSAYPFQTWSVTITIGPIVVITNEDLICIIYPLWERVTMHGHLCLQFSFNLVTPDTYVKFISLNAGDYYTLQSEGANINCKDMMNMTMDAVWQYTFYQI